MAAGGINGMPALPQDAVMGGAEMNSVGSGLAQAMAIPGQDLSMGGMNGTSGLASFPGAGISMANGGVDAGVPQQQQQQQQSEPQVIE